MKNARAAIRYAKAILNLAKDSKEETAVNDDMLFIASTISENETFEVMLKSPIVKPSEKTKVLKALFEGKVNNITLGLFHLLQDNKRISMLLSIAKQYAIIYDFDKNIKVAKVTTAVPLTEEIEKKVLAKIVAITGDKANIENVVNPAILGGFILRVGDVQYDASISNYLYELKKEFDNSHFIPKI
ncbi:ATP synthase F1 subunit delta [Polaribacter sejongensis]|uniref:ATP synthase subunit delta n=1 Tax=Polaribacter sejongensis TaxID=985043 RepID=A0AAJ1VFI6_9FLAO|nr:MULTISPECIES: ATP synthase F1 subunit delta [Polaribacter]AUC21718.1 ATP synthase F1 subunit delta [Polaribacter sejongensis]MDN3618344.1 ATP synthase F1 subunit delta [Polaribacter undariae]UWD30671.1 ATP synthase F1 subunit delta [Polaribacter undariae]